MKIVNAYLSWAKNETRHKVVIAYETMWGSTEKMARKIADGIADAGVSVRLYNVAQFSRTEVIKDMLDAKGYLFGSSTHDNDMLPSIGGFLVFFRGLKPKNRIASIFGSYGWAGGAVGAIERNIREAGLEVNQPPISFKWVPDESELKLCYEFGREFANKVKQN